MNDRLTSFLSKYGNDSSPEKLQGDASTREYFRIRWQDSTAVICVYPIPFVESVANYIDVTELFLSEHLPVANILAVGHENGVIVQEDLGGTLLKTELDAADDERREWLLREAISLLTMIQLATDRSVERASIASKLKFDVEKLTWEFNYFREHYFTTLSGRPLDDATNEELTKEFNEIAAELESKASVLCHRDFHAANLMIDRNGKMRIIDHQDARIGSPSYDLVSLLLDRIETLPSPEWLAEKRRYFLRLRRTLGLPAIDEAEFANEFRIQTVQRCLKAVGTFSYQSAARGKTEYLKYILPMFKITVRGISNLGRFPTIAATLANEIEYIESNGLPLTDHTR